MAAFPSGSPIYRSLRAQPGSCLLFILPAINGTLKQLLDALTFVEPGAAVLSLRSAHYPRLNVAQDAFVGNVFECSHGLLDYSILELPKKIGYRLSAYQKDIWGRLVQPVVSILRVPYYVPYSEFFFKAEQLSQVGSCGADFYVYTDDHEFTARFTRCKYPIYRVSDWGLMIWKIVRANARSFVGVVDLCWCTAKSTCL